MKCAISKSYFLLLLLGLCLLPAASFAQIAVGVSIHVGPPVLPVYAQPPCPVDGDLWTPGYWAYGADGYYWVPGVWVQPPRVGLLWTPGYWGFVNGAYLWHAGYWGPHVGFYGGINYGFGYAGVGFIGGRWAGGHFMYNTAVMRVNATVVRNVYVDRTVIHDTVVNHASFNGPGGINRQPSPQEQRFAGEQHLQPTAEQMSHERTMGQDRAQLASANHGRPGTVAMDSVNGRRYNQQQRIGNGVRSGQLSPSETANLEHREANINRSVAADRAANGGRLNAQQKATINKRQNAASKQIYKDKHNDEKAPK